MMTMHYSAYMHALHMDDNDVNGDVDFAVVAIHQRHTDGWCQHYLNI